MPKPAIIPALQTWTDHEGVFTLQSSTRLIVAPLFFSSLADTMLTIQSELNDLTSLSLEIASGPFSASGDIFFTLDDKDKLLTAQGYFLEITPAHVLIRAKTSVGLFYAVQTLRQMLMHDPEKKLLPCGTTYDEPAFCERAIMLDAGRKFWKLDYLFKLIERMAHFKLNVLHLHFSDWSGFRLASDLKPDLAATDAYSKRMIAQLETHAKKYHIMIVPEIDLPAHANIFTAYDPSLAFTCESMSKSRWPGGQNGGWTINYLDAKARSWMKDLVNEFMPLFSGPYFHIGADEVPERDCLENCPQLRDGAKTTGYSYPGDALVAWINEMNFFVKQHGKQLQIWNWYERSLHSLQVDSDVIINAWVDTGEPDEFLHAGYKVVATPENTHYITPGIDNLPNNSYLYQGWQPETHLNMLGYKLCVWADNREHESDEYFDGYLREPFSILAERTWNREIPSKSLKDFLALANILMSEA